VKITDSDTIKNSETELIDGLIGELDWQVIESILKEKYNLKLHDDVEYTSGDIIVHGKKIAYKLNFDVRVTLSLLVGRDGECFDIKASGSQGEEDILDMTTANQEDGRSPETEIEVSDPSPVPSPPLRQTLRKNQEVVSHIADIINEIND